MSRVGKLFCRRYIAIIRVLAVLLLFSLLANYYSLILFSSYRETAYRALAAIGAHTYEVKSNKDYIDYLLAKVKELSNELNSIKQANQQLEKEKFPKIRAVVTAYTPHYRSTGKTENHPLFNVTWSGFKGGGGVCAADPKYWPMGTVLYINGLGACVVLDTGGAIKGRYRFDYYIPGDEKSAEEAAFKWGKREVEVIVLHVPKKHIFWREVKNGSP